MFKLGAFERCGIKVKFASSIDPKDYEAVIDEKTKAIFIESVANPSGIIHDIEAIAKVRSSTSQSWTNYESIFRLHMRITLY